MLYVRMFITTVISLYTSRVVLQQLGVSDYGVYGVVGGIVGMMSFINASMGGATSRFISYELGRADAKKLSETFSASLEIHLGIAFAILLICETAGLWFLNYKLVIPQQSMTAAHWVFQFSILSALLGITQTPYNATIMAHEKMDVYAYIEILNVSLKLIIAYLLIIVDYNKLILYAALTFGVTLLISIIYRVYCLRKFPETRFHFTRKRNIIKPMLSFSVWNLYGSFCVSARQQGVNFLLNIFFGTIVNAASGIATTVSGTVLGFSYNIVGAVRPQIIKSYAVSDIQRFQTLIDLSCKFAGLAMTLLTIPLLISTEQIIFYWLGEVPEYVISFIRITLLTTWISIFNLILQIGIHATGQMKTMSLLTGTTFLLSVPVSYVFLKYGFSPQSTYVIVLISFVIALFINQMILSQKVQAYISQRTMAIIGVNVLFLAIGIIICTLVCKGVTGWQKIVVSSITSMVYVCIVAFIVLTKTQRATVLKYVLKR